MYPIHKNSYLQTQTPIDPRIINRCVDKAREQPTIDQFDAFPPFNRLTSEQPCIPIPNCDVTRRPLAFGRWAMPKLRRELHSKDPTIQMQALNSLSDVVHDPERNFEAIRLRIPDRLRDLLEHDDPAVRERVLMILATIGGLMDGKQMIVNNKKLLNNIGAALWDPHESVRFKAAALIQRLSELWTIADELVENDFVKILIAKLEEMDKDEDGLALYLEALYVLMYCSGKFIALECNLYELLIKILDRETNDENLRWCLKCFGMLTSTEEGKQLALKYKLIKKLNLLLNDERPPVYEGAAAAMLFATIKTKALVKAYKLKGLKERLLTLAKNWHEPSTQKYCLQIIANMCGHGKFKKDFVNNHFEEVEQIYVNHDPAAERVKEILLRDIFII